ncbi:nanoRNase/pAp phosphatase, hydrolyzes c-di-AMP and oligoRNAs [Halomicrobium zhouii]|uniref:NanoRNase/pAp phosphatase, hydrolyzes c-di-AMP and oligoRNAs n=1 Tax=Halomicrobium zhouii TaxID=767519 RepID=A0A1I6LB51_9EURY|nr:bifunctional oligoribonuclease/PAP phosphatase NrnA [Halomicrobium zhouii]SFS00440.1 nanoRNase/pAp phosphatase, hydrolyzes c-di-AMP and oligoRNAs [Halomicrobium zhouii]
MRLATALADYLTDKSFVAVICHREPDPDCLASAVAFGTIAHWCGAETVEYFDGTRISRPQNLALIAHLDVNLRPVSELTPAEPDVLALVDHAVPGVHDGLTRDTQVDVILDHHEHDRPVTADFVDVRPEYGATATLFVEYLRELGVPVSARLASALLFALHRERLDQVRHPTRHDYLAAAAMLPLSDPATIDHLYRAGMKPTTIDAIATAIRNRRTVGSCLVSWVGPIPDREALPQTAEYLLNLQSVDTVLALGVVDDEVHLSARTVDQRVNLATVLPSVIGTAGSGGGHRDMAGGVIPAARLDTSARDGGDAAPPAVDDLGSRFCTTVERAKSAGVVAEPGPPVQVVDTAVEARSDGSNALPDAVSAGVSDDAVSPRGTPSDVHQ